MDELWTCDCEHIVLNKKNDVKVQPEKLTVKKYGWKSTFLWKAATLGKVRTYSAYDGEKCIHSSYVVRGKEKFLFLKKEDIEIGPCWTHPDYRGRGIYPYVLAVILRSELSGGGTAYMIIKDTNIPSQHGVSKVGFTRTGELVKRDLMKRYKKI